MINLHPTSCNLCHGRVIYTSNSAVYGKKYGSGWCYLCTNCGAYVGTHRPRPKEALGLLADQKMREGKICCHELFDRMWKGKPKAGKKRRDLYAWLAKRMEISVDECHFGWMELQQLRCAYKILKAVENMPMKYDSKGRLYFEGEK